MVRWADHSGKPGADPDVVLGHLPAPGVGAGQGRAAASGLSAVEVVERRVEVQVPLVPTRHDWPSLLGVLAGQLNDERVYDRDLPALALALQPVVEAYRRRAHLTGARYVR